MAFEKEPEDDLLEGLYHRQLEKSTPMLNATALYHCDQIHRKEPKSFLKPEAVTDVLKDQQHTFFTAQKRKGRAKDTAIPVATVNTEGDRKTRDCWQQS